MSVDGEVQQDTFELGEFRLQSGRVLPEARLVYAQYGTLAPDRSNVVLYPTSYGAQHTDIDWLVGPGKILDTNRWFVVIPNMFTNGLSSSPSNCVPALRQGRWPLITHVDNVGAQRRLLREEFGIEKLALVYGWSMGAQQALHWGALYPDEVARICAVCGSARTSPHNKVMIEGIVAALTGDPDWRGGWFDGRAERGLRAMGRVYASWAMSQAFYRNHLYRASGAETIEDFVVRFWEGNFIRRNPNDLLAQFDTWLHSDVSANEKYDGDLARALGAVAARALIMPSTTDLYFTVADSELETAMMPNAKLCPIVSDFGHRAGNPTHSPDDERVLREAVRELMSNS